MTTLTVKAPPSAPVTDDRPPRGTLRRAVRLTGVTWVQIATSVGLGTLALGSAVALGSVSAWMIARASQMPLPGVLSVAAVGVRAFGIGRGVLRYLERLASHDTAFRGMTTLRTTVYARLADGTAEAVLRVRRGDLLARVGADVDEVGNLVVRGIIPVGVAITLGLSTSIAMAILWPPAGIALAVALLLAGWVAPTLTAVSVRRAEQNASAARARMTSVALGMLDDAGPLRVSGRTDDEIRHLASADADIAKAVDLAAGPAALASGIGLAAQGAAVIAALVTGVPAVTSGLLAPTELAVIVLTPLAAFEATTALPMAAVQLQRSRAAAARILAILDQSGSTSDEPVVFARTDARRAGILSLMDGAATPGDERPEPATTPAASGPLSPVVRALHAADLSCGWTGRDPVLTHVDLDLRVGRTVAVAGASGAGKTTLMLTLAGLLTPRAGELRLGDDEIGALPRHEVVRSVVATTEDAHVFGTTVLENLRVARGDVDEAQAQAALAQVGLIDWLDSLPEGLDTLLGPDARTVSGGERRRLLLARAWLAPAPILLRDEPGEHLDPATADLLITDLLTPRPDRGVLVVTHRVSPLARADEVLWIEGGRIAARGTHAELLASVPHYESAARQEQEAIEEAG